MVRVRIGVVMVSGGSVTMLMAVVMRVVMVMTVMVVVPMIVAVIVMRRAGADAFHVVMVAFLLKAYFRLEAKHLFTVLAHLAVHVAGAFQDLGHPIGKGLQNQRMVVQV